jgi:hypothetical protein
MQHSQIEKEVKIKGVNREQLGTNWRIPCEGYKSGQFFFIIKANDKGDLVK